MSGMRVLEGPAEGGPTGEAQQGAGMQIEGRLGARMVKHPPEAQVVTPRSWD